MSRKTVVTTRSYEVTLFSANSESRLGFCPSCSKRVLSLDLDSAVAFADTNARELLARISAGSVHSYENSSGLLRICVNSLISVPGPDGKDTQIETIK